MNKNMNFIYYRPELATNNDITVKLNKYFEKIENSPDKYKDSLTPGLTNIQLHEIIHHQEYALSNGVICKSPLWELRFLHKRIDVPSVVDEKSNDIKAAAIDANEKIAEVTILIYDPTTDIVIINRTQSGVSYSKIAEFINYFVDYDPVTEDSKKSKKRTKSNAIQLAIMTDNKIIDLVKRKAIYTGVSARLLSSLDASLSAKAPKLKTKSLRSIIQAHTESETPTEYSATIMFDMHVNTNNKKAHIGKNFARDFIDDIKLLAENNMVGKCLLKAKDRENDSVREFDLLNYIVKDSHSFEVTPTDRYITEKAISQAIVLEYNTNKRANFLKGKK